jgi:hypothetical protein
MLTMANVDGSGRQLKVVVHMEGVYVEAGSFSGTLEAFCEKAEKENKTRYSKVVKATAEALLADCNDRNITGGW